MYCTIIYGEEGRSNHMEQKMKHLELIQEVIKRMANNSFLLKGWTVTLVTGILALASKDTDKQYFWIAYIPILIFWLLDAYYLQQERLYRSLYEKVRKIKNKDIDFSLKATTKEFKNNKNNYFAVVFSFTEIAFYLPLIIVCTIVIKNIFCYC